MNSTVIIVPEPGYEELADANWIDWYALEGHDQSQYKKDNAAFWANHVEDDNTTQDWIAHMTAAGWTVKLATLEWAVG